VTQYPQRLIHTVLPKSLPDRRRDDRVPVDCSLSADEWYVVHICVASAGSEREIATGRRDLLSSEGKEGDVSQG
jgi:hypothetical protein